jgi:cytochrome c oxidase subunit IV
MHAGPTKSVLIFAYVALLLLLAASAGGAFLPMSLTAKTIFALAIAAAKTAIIFLIFMQLRYQSGLIRVFALAGFFWLAISAALTFSDYLTRGSG